MKLKKLLTGATALTMTVLLLSACGSNDTKDSTSTDSSSSEVAKDSSSDSKESTTDGDLVDGTYKLEQKNYKNGYRVVFDIVVKDGKIVESNYDSVNEAGESKVDDTEYNESMKAKSGTDAATYIPELNKELVEKQNADDVEVVTGATHSSDDFKEYAAKLIEAAKKGDHDTIEIDNKVD